MKKILKNIAAVAGLSLAFSHTALAAAPTWQIDPKASSITFSATQNNAPVAGKFNTFSGDIAFDPNELATSHIRIVVDTASVSTSYADVADTLKTPDWFNIKVFPQAVFAATQFTKTGDKTFQANGTLQIRDKTIPVTLPFTLDDYSTTKAHATGSITLKRTQFGVGQGDWAKTDNVKDDVTVTYVVQAQKK